MPMAPSGDPRLDTVMEHMRLENAKDFAGCIAEFGDSARYDVLASEETYAGDAAVHEFLVENHTAFPDFDFVAGRVSPGPDVVVVEGRFTGTHLGPWRGLPPTGRRVDFAMCLVFEFAGESMVAERLYFDLATPLHQLGVADDPDTLRGKVTAALTHPIVVGGSAARSWWTRLRRRR